MSNSKNRFSQSPFLLYKKSQQGIHTMKKAIFLPHICELSKQNNIALGEALLIARNEGYTGVDANWKDIGRENILLKNQLNTADIYYTLDTGNYAYFNEDVLYALSELKDRIVHVHLKDWCLSPFDENDESTLETITNVKLYPSPIGRGIVPIKDCIKKLYEYEYKGYLTAEFFGAKNMLNYLKISFPKNL